MRTVNALLLTDNIFTKTMLDMFLSDHGFKVCTSSEWLEALNWVLVLHTTTQPLDLVVLDATSAWFPVDIFMSKLKDAGLDTTVVLLVDDKAGKGPEFPAIDANVRVVSMAQATEGLKEIITAAESVGGVV